MGEEKTKIHTWKLPDVSPAILNFFQYPTSHPLRTQGEYNVLSGEKNKVAKHAHVFINHTLMIWFISFLLPLTSSSQKKVLHTKRIVSCFHRRLQDGSILYPQLIGWWSPYTFMDFSSPNVLLCMAAVSQKSSTGVKKCRWQIISQRFFRQLAMLCACNGWKVLKKKSSSAVKTQPSIRNQTDIQLGSRK